MGRMEFRPGMSSARAPGYHAIVTDEDRIVAELLRAAQELAGCCESLTFSAPVRHVYNPLVYAREPHERYLRRFGGRPGRCVLLGMNPGPWGMAQTGVPFGDVVEVATWLGLGGQVACPPSPHPAKPVRGFACRRREVSGSRLWGWARRRFGTPERFFGGFFVANYCPLMFLDAGGRNLTPDRLPAAERGLLLAACDRALLRVVEALEPTRVVGVGAWAEAQARRALAGRSLAFGRVLHPSPASPPANRGWAEQAERQLCEQGVRLEPEGAIL